jgi:hypothetical protein
VGCGRQKADVYEPVPAADLYTSGYFQCKRRYAEAVARPADDAPGGTPGWTILSAKHDILWPSLEVEPYDTTIADLDERDAPVEPDAYQHTRYPWDEPEYHTALDFWTRRVHYGLASWLGMKSGFPEEDPHCRRLIVLAGLFLFARGSLDGVSAVGLAFGGAAGFIVCTFWHRSIEGYRRLNGTRYQILNRLEEDLPAPVYRDEWRYLKQKDKPLELLSEPDPKTPIHTSHTIVERWLVRLLAVGYLLVTLYAVALLYLTYLHPLPLTALPMTTVLPGILLVVATIAIIFYWRYR